MQPVTIYHEVCICHGKEKMRPSSITETHTDIRLSLFPPPLYISVTQILRLKTLTRLHRNVLQRDVFLSASGQLLKRKDSVGFSVVSHYLQRRSSEAAGNVIAPVRKTKEKGTKTGNAQVQ